jgi:hypothetical protein
MEHPESYKTLYTQAIDEGSNIHQIGNTANLFTPR